MKPKNKKQTSIKIAIIAGIVLFSLVVPKIVLAAWDPVKDIAGSILYRLTDFIHGFLAFFVRAGADFFEYMLNLGFKSNLDVVKTGWEVTRDFSNMFFILFMVIIAFTTILRTEKYGIKQLLPKIILIALLINFSFVIAGVIIDFSNIAANFFISDIKKYTDVNKGGISGAFADSLSLPKTQTGIDCEKEYDNKIKECGGIEEEDINTKCLFKAKFWYEDCVKAESAFFGDWANVLSLLISSTFGSIVLLVATFTFFAGGIILIIRIVIIWFLLMFVPLIFLCYIMPGLRKMWQIWWSTFLRWCFFAPAYAFFVWLAFKVAVENQNKKLAAGVESTFSGYIATGPGANLFTADAGQQLIGYAFMIALLLGGLIAASKFGIYGADTAMKVGKGIYGGAKGWTRARIRERAAKPMETMARGLAKVPLFGKLAKIPVRTMAAQRKDIEEAKKKISQSPDTIKSLWPRYTRTEKIAAAQFLAEKGKFSAGGNLKELDLKKIVKVAKIYDSAGPMLTNRPDLAPAVKKPTQTNEQAVEGQIGKIKVADAEKIQFESFLDPNTVAAMFKQFSGPHFEKIAQSNIRAANILQGAIHSLAPGNATQQKARLSAINPRLAIYINNAAASGTGTYRFG